MCRTRGWLPSLALEPELLHKQSNASTIDYITDNCSTQAPQWTMVRLQVWKSNDIRWCEVQRRKCKNAVMQGIARGANCQC